MPLNSSMAKVSCLGFLSVGKVVDLIYYWRSLRTVAVASPALPFPAVLLGEVGLSRLRDDRATYRPPDPASRTDRRQFPPSRGERYPLSPGLVSNAPHAASPSL